jgi:hypothetical protein
VEILAKGELLPPGASGSGEIKLFDVQDNLIYRSRFEPELMSPMVGPPGGPSMFTQIVPESSLTPTHRIELYAEGQLQDIMTRTANSPQVTVLSPLPGSTLNQGTVIEWQASDADGDELYADVLYSPDNGASWTAVVVWQEDSQHRLDGQNLASASGTGVIRIVVTDGMNTSVAEVGGLTLGPNRPPRVHVVLPRTGSTYKAGANVILAGSAYDSEDGWLPDSSVSWTSDIDGFLGNGPGFNKSDLSPGTHRMTFSATDSQGANSTASVTITIQ